MGGSVTLLRSDKLPLHWPWPKALKEKLVKQEWADGNDYNAGKDTFLKEYEKKAVEWHENSQQ